MKSYLMQRCIKQPNGCWEWTKAKTSWGYGVFRDGLKMKMPHKEMYRLFKGEVTDDLFVCHSCDNRGCMNPDHLFLGTQQDNMDDMKQKGRHRSVPQYGNNYTSKKVLANGQEFISYCAAARALGISDNGIRKRISLKWDGYRRIE